MAIAFQFGVAVRDGRVKSNAVLSFIIMKILIYLLIVFLFESLSVAKYSTVKSKPILKVNVDTISVNDTLFSNYIVISNPNKDESNLPTILLIPSFLINFILAYITIKQHLILIKNETPYLHSNTFVEVIDKTNYPKEKEEFLKYNSRFYINLINVGNVPLSEFWIRMPDNVSITSTADGKRFNFKIFYIDEPILPDEKLVIHLSAEDFFGNNFKILEDKRCDIEIKYKGANENKYRLLKVPFNIKHQKENVISDYKITFANSITLKGNEILPYDDNDWNEIN